MFHTSVVSRFALPSVGRNFIGGRTFGNTLYTRRALPLMGYMEPIVPSHSTLGAKLWKTMCNPSLLGNFRSSVNTSCCNSDSKLRVTLFYPIPFGCAREFHSAGCRRRVIPKSPIQWKASDSVKVFDYVGEHTCEILASRGIQNCGDLWKVLRSLAQEVGVENLTKAFHRDYFGGSKNKMSYRACSGIVREYLNWSAANSYPLP